MATTQAATEHDHHKGPTATQQTSREQTYGQRQLEQGPESSPPLHRYFGNSYVQAMTATDDSGGLPAPLAPMRPSQSGIVQRNKCACGNPATSGRCSQCGKKQRLGLQTKLTVNEPGDIYEQEADRVADQVLAAPVHTTISEAPPHIQSFSGQSNVHVDVAPASVDHALASPGRPLDTALRLDMEQRFGHNFSRVRVHTDATAAQSAQDVNAQAYTVGNSVVFDASRFAPGTSDGRRLLAHELTHVVQQAGGEGSSSGSVQRQPARPLPVSTDNQFELLNEIQREFSRSHPRETKLTDAFNVLDPSYAALVNRAIVSGPLGAAFQKLPTAVQGRLKTLLAQRRAAVPVLPPGVYGKGVKRLNEWDYFIVRHGVTIDEIANYLSDDPKLPSVLESRNSMAHDQVLAAGTLVYFPRDSFKRMGARQQLSQDLRSGSFIYPWGAFKVSHTEPRTYHRGDVLLTRSEFESIRENEIQQKHGAEAVKQIAATDEANKAKQLKGDVKRAQQVPNAPLSLLFPTSRLYFKDQSSLISNPLLRFQYQTNLRGFDAGTNLYREAGAVAVAVNLAPLAILEGSALAGFSIPALPTTIQGVSTTVWAKTLAAAGLSSSYLRHVVTRSEEAAATEGGSNPISIVSAAILDTSGAGEVIEAAENESLLTGKPLHRSKGERAAGAIKGTLEFALNFFGAKSFFDDSVPQVKAPRRAATEPPSEPPPSLAPSPSPAPVPQVVSPAPTAPVAPPAAVRPTPLAVSVRPPTASPVAPVPVKPTSPVAPVRPVTLTGFRRWLFGTKLSLTMKGVDLSDVHPGIGAGGTIGTTRPAPAVIAKTTPSPAAPTPDLLPKTPVSPPVVSPPKIVTPLAPSRPTAQPAPAPLVAPAPPARTVAPAPAQNPVGKTPQSPPPVQVSLPRLPTPQPANENVPILTDIEKARQKRTQPQQQVMETPLAATGTGDVAPAKIVESGGQQQDASRVHIIASGERETPGRGTPVPGSVRTSETAAPSQAQAPSATPSQRGFDDNEPTNVDRLPYGTTQGPQASLASLLQFLSDVWVRRQEILAQGDAGAVYDLYRYKPDATSRTALSEEQRVRYLRSQEALVQELGLPRLTDENGGELWRQAVERGEPRVRYAHQQGDPETGFLQFRNQRRVLRQNRREIVERIYLSVRAENAPEVMRFVTRELVFNAQTTGIGGAKLAGPREVSQRRDAIVIYSEDLASTERALERILEYQRTHPTHFEDSPVPMTQPISRGISVGSDPVSSSEEVSFGSVRAEAIYEALAQATSWEDFFHRVEQNFRTRRIDPAQPHRNLPPPTPPPRTPSRR
ncbi:MAG: DUF4157 domain-containing protein [Deltaproteobacteria bacterium]|nr:DUF4157 domain-containing protein [Deltaproteobacteria bacterium]